MWTYVHDVILNFVVYPCSHDSECHEFGHCDGMWCKCNDGYTGDGLETCKGESAQFFLIKFYYRFHRICGVFLLNMVFEHATSCVRDNDVSTAPGILTRIFKLALIHASVI